VSPVRLFALTAADSADAAPLPVGTQGISFRDLTAVVQEIPVVRTTLVPADLAAHRAVVDALFVERPVLPAPPGLAFPARESLARWLELHYVALSDALAFLDGRSEARVYVERVPMTPPHGVPTLDALAPDVSAAAADVFRHLRKHAAASIVMRPPEDRPATALASFLVERERWAQFEAAVLEQGDQDPDLRFRVTGPWPPYDFVRMQFGG
jgi:Gas vesicle synthesis protein GvpL/GvpF